MCVRIRFAPSIARPIFDADGGAITVPGWLCPSLTAIAVRAVLSELRVEQPQFGAVCWCGEDIDLPPRVPNQRRTEQVIIHGA
jgi:hypothetical protein